MRNLGEPMIDEWSVSITDDDQRTMTAANIVAEYQRGTLDLNDTYVWREGMADWVPLGQEPELMAMIGQPGASHPPLGAPPESQPPTSAIPSDSRPGVGYAAEGVESLPPSVGTVVMDSPGASAPYPGAVAEAGVAAGGFDAAGQADSPYAGMMDEPTDAVSASPGPAAGWDPSMHEAPRAARRDGGPTEDVFEAQAQQQAGAAPPPSEGPRMIGQRGEMSSLFSIEDIHREAASRVKAEPPMERAEIDDIMGLGGDLGAGIASTSFEPPPLDAPPPPTPPPAPVVPVAPVQQPLSASEDQLLAAARLGEPPPAKSRTAVVVAAILGVAIFGAVAIFVFMRQPAEVPVASTHGETPTAEPDEARAEVAPPEEPSTTEQAGSGGGGSAEASDEAEDEEPADEASSDSDEDPDERDPQTASPASTRDKTSTADRTEDEPKKEEPKKEEPEKEEPKKEEPKSDDQPKGEFSRDAAVAALNGAAGRAAGCKQAGGPTGRGRVSVTFAPSGRATTAVVGPPFAGTSVGSCAAAAFRSASVPPFSGGPVTVSKSFYIK